MRIGRAGVLWASVAQIIGAFAPATAAAQDSLSFSTVDLSAGVSAVASPPALSNHWRSSPGVFLSAMTPYGAGALRLMVEASRHRAMAGDLPDYVTLFSSVEWGLGRRLLGPVHGMAGAGLAGVWHHFEDVTNPTELELGVTATFELRADLGRGWTLGTGTSVRRILLSEPITQRAAFVRVGLRRPLRPPLRRLLVGAGTDAAPAQTLQSSEDGGYAPPPAPPLSAAATAERQETWLSARELGDRGVQRLPEVFQALGWDRATVDHRTFWATPDGLDPPLALPYAFIDNVPVLLPNLGGATLDLLPLALEEVRGIHASSSPGRFAGRFTERGAIHFTTSAPGADGFGAFTAALAENATGDPGPLLYTDSSAANVDKLGSGYAVGARWRAGQVSASAGFRYNSDLVTDHRLAGRTLSLMDPLVAYPVVRTHAPWLSVRIDGESVGRHDFRAGRATRSDYLFLPALGFEVPTRTTFAHAGAAGEVRGPLGVIWGYAAHTSWSELAPSPNDLGFAFDLRTRRTGVQVEASSQLGRNSLRAGFGIDGDWAASPLLPSDVSSTDPRAWVGGSRQLGRSDVGLDVELRSTDRGRESRWSAWGRTPVGDDGYLRWDLWHVRAPPGETDGLWSLHAMGYRFLEQAEVEVRVGPSYGHRLSGGQIRVLELPVGSSLEIAPFFRVSRSDGARIERQTFRREGPRPGQAAPVALTSAGRTTLLMAGAEVHWWPHPRLGVDVRYRWVDAVAGDELAREAWRSHPTHRVTQSAFWSARADLQIGVATEGSSASFWSGFDGLGVGRLPGGVRLDAWLEKTLWDGRVTLRGMLRNLLDREIAYHPLGAAPGLSIALGARTRVGL